MMGALPQSSARPFNRKLGFVYAKYFANHRHNAALPRSYFLDQLCQADRRENPKPVVSEREPGERHESKYAKHRKARLSGLCPCRFAWDRHCQVLVFWGNLRFAKTIFQRTLGKGIFCMRHPFLNMTRLLLEEGESDLNPMEGHEGI